MKTRKQNKNDIDLKSKNNKANENSSDGWRSYPKTIGMLETEEMSVSHVTDRPNVGFETYTADW